MINISKINIKESYNCYVDSSKLYLNAK